ncbi:MAG: hypothetical protein ACRCVI_01120 [Mycoplasmoidaceae bacterium]
MNKKIKLGLISALMLGSTISIVLPVVSCSSSEQDVPLTVKKAEAPVFKELATLFTKVGNPDATDNTAAMTRTHYNTIVNTNYQSTTHPEIFDKVKEAFQFSKGSATTPEDFDTVIDKVTVKGTYKNPDNLNVNLTITLTLKKGYSANASDLSETFQIGTMFETLTVTNGDAAALDALGYELTKLGNPNATSNNERITKTQFDAIMDKTITAEAYPAVWEKLTGYFIFKDGVDAVLKFEDVVSQVRLVASYPTTGNVNIEINLDVHSYYNFTSPIKRNVKVGVVIALTVTKASATVLNNLAREFARIVNPGTYTNQEQITEAQLGTLIGTYTSSSRPAVWNLLGQYFQFKGPDNASVPFNQAVSHAVAGGAYPSGNDIYLTVVLHLNSGYSTTNPNDITLITQNMKIGEKTTAISIRKDPEKLSAVQNELRAIATAIGNPNHQISKADFDKIVGTNFNGALGTSLRRELNEYYIFNRPGSSGLTTDTGRLSLSTVFASITVTGTYPEGQPAGTNVNVELTITLNNNYRAETVGLLTSTFKVGII